MRFLSTDGPVDLGSGYNGDKGTTYLDEFSPGEQLIGFYGSYTDTEITSLGFLTHDPTCIAIPEAIIEKEVIEETTVELEVTVENVELDDEGPSMGIIIGAAAGGLVVIILGVVGFLIWRRRRNNKD